MRHAIPILLVLAVATGFAAAQINPGDLIICHFDWTQNPATGGRIYCLDPSSGKSTTLQQKLPGSKSTWCPLWAEMGPLNKSIWVAYSDPVAKNNQGVLHVLDRTGTVTSVTPIFGEILAFRFTDNNDFLMVHNDSLLQAPVRDMGKAVTLVTGLPGWAVSNSEIEDTGDWCVTNQGGSGSGGVSVVDLKKRAVVKSIAGRNQIWGGDYHRGDGHMYAVERVGMAGYLFRYDLAKGTYTTVIDANTTLGQTTYRLMWVKYDHTDHTLWMGGRNQAHRFDPATRTLLGTWPYEASSAITNCFFCATIYGSRPLQLYTGNLLPGPSGSVMVILNFPHLKAPRASYFLSASFALRPGLQLPDGHYVDLRPDPLFFSVLSGALAPIFQNFQGVLNGSGQATATVQVPPVPALSGLRLFVGGVAVIGGQIVPTNCEGFTIP